MSGGSHGVSPVRHTILARHGRFIASRRGGGWKVLGAAPVSRVDLKAAQSNNGMHLTRFSANVIRKIESLFSCVRAGDAGR